MYNVKQWMQFLKMHYAKYFIVAQKNVTTSLFGWSLLYVLLYTFYGSSNSNQFLQLMLKTHCTFNDFFPSLRYWLTNTYFSYACQASNYSVLFICIVPKPCHSTLFIKHVVLISCWTLKLLRHLPKAHLLGNIIFDGPWRVVRKYQYFLNCSPFLFSVHTLYMYM